MDLMNRLSPLPLVAILRGLEVPLNSPDPFDSIARMKAAVGDRAVVGAGTVLDVASVQRVRAAGGELVISPNTNAAVIAETKALGMASMPAFFTPTEAFEALDAGADALKLFPAEGASPVYLKAIRAVLPAPVLVVGGLTPDNMGPWREAGASGFGIGSSLFRPGRTAAEVGARATDFVAAWR